MDRRVKLYFDEHRTSDSNGQPFGLSCSCVLPCPFPAHAGVQAIAHHKGHKF